MGKASRIRAQRRLRHGGETALLQRVRNLGLAPEVRVLKDPAGLEKMSEVIEEFAGPLLEHCSRMDQRRGAIGLAVTAWNLSLLPDEEREKELSQHILPKTGPEMKDILTTMVKRKQALYRDIQRLILDYEITDKGKDALRLTVISAVPRDKIPADQLDGIPSQPGRDLQRGREQRGR